MLTALEYAALGFETFHDDVLAPLIIEERSPLTASVYQCHERIQPEHAQKMAFTEVPLGWRWGPVWSTAWFQLKGEIPQSMRGRPLSLQFSSGTEALLWNEGVPYQGFDPYHHHASLKPTHEKEVSFLIEAACNRPLGASLFWWEHQEEHQRWKEEQPGRLEYAELQVRNETIERLCRTWLFAVRLMRTASDNSNLIHKLERGLRDLKREILGAESTQQIENILPKAEALLSEGSKSATQCVAIGHAHIDTAWLWPLSETRRKCLRTFATQLRNIERFPSFHFLCSQPLQYAYIEEENPQLFQEITKQVHAGRWEPFGAMWIEPDANIPSGESLIRQILHGTHYFKDKFGDAAPQTALYLPDTFGFPASLPQICRLAGLKTFITNKMAWSETNRFPHVTFRWRGIDGTDVLTHFTPGHNYNSSIQPQDFVDAEDRLLKSDGTRCTLWLQPYGWGDGGGGPDPEQISNAQLGAIAADLPHVASYSATRFCEELHKECGETNDQPIWDGELYLELHRGTYTTHARLKASNRKAERELREIEALAIATRSTHPDIPQELEPWLDTAWKTVLLNQFHDILPGSSIKEVYDEAHEQMDHVHLECAQRIDEGLRRIAGEVDTQGMQRPVMTWNPSSSTRSGVIKTDAGDRFIEHVPAMGIQVVDLAEEVTLQNPVQASQYSLNNGLVGMTIDDTGQVTELTHFDRNVPLLEPSNALVLYTDRPRRWQAWDIDRDYVDHQILQNHPAERITLLEQSELRGVIEYEKTIGASSRIIQRYILDAGSPVIRIETHLDWHEEHMLLRALFTPDIRARSATFGIQFGSIERPTHVNTSWEKAAFEVPGHLWMDLSEPGSGFAVLDDGSRIGRSCRENQLGLSLVRATNFPDPTADQGIHEFAYGLMPHEGDWRKAQVPNEAESFGNQLRTIPVGAGAPGSIRSPWNITPIDSDSTGIEIAACKPALDGNGIILRLVELHGAKRTLKMPLPDGIQQVQDVDLRERTCQIPGLHHADNSVAISLKPYQIRTLRLL